MRSDSVDILEFEYTCFICYWIWECIGLQVEFDKNYAVLW